ncbi:hypothetical protein ABPG74_003027 [Tetrahymena malaccensis]
MNKKQIQFSDLNQFKDSSLSTHTDIRLFLGRNLQDQQKILFFSLLAQCQALQNLDLYLSGFKFQSKQASELGLALSSCENLESLNIDSEWDNINDQVACDFGFSLQGCKKLSQLNLNFSNNEIGDNGAFGLLAAISNCKNISTLKICFDVNQVGDTGLIKLASELKSFDNLSNLKLGFYDNSKISSKGISALGSGLALCLNLQKLELKLAKHPDQWKGSISVESSALTDLGFSLSKCHKLKVLKIGLNQNYFGDDGLIGFCSGLANCKGLTFLQISLQNDEISGKGILALSTALQKLSALSDLDVNFNQNQIDAVSTLNFIKSLKNCQNTRVLKLYIQDEKLKSVGRQLSSQILKIQGLVTNNSFIKYI